MLVSRLIAPPPVVPRLVLLGFFGAFLATASAQVSAPQAAHLASPVKHAGTYHVASGTWSRGGSNAPRAGADVIYSNTALSGYYLTTAGFGGTSTHFDEGAIPGASNPFHPAADRDVYDVSCVAIGYCDFGAPGSGGWELGFYNSYSSCAGPLVPSAVVTTGALPANGCWNLELDLSGGLEFCLPGDGGNGYSPVGSNGFGWSFQYAGSDPTAGVNRGFLLAGDPLSTDPGFTPGGVPTDATNTYFGVASLCTSGGVGGGPAGSGYLTGDAWWSESTVGALNASGCYFLGAYGNSNGCGGPLSSPFGSFYLELEAEAAPCAAPVDIGTTYCTSLPNPTGMNSTLTIFGDASVAANNVKLVATVTPGSIGYYLASTTGTAGSPLSAGILCLGGNIGRFIRPGQIQMANAMGEGIDLDTRLGEWSLAGIPTSTGPYAATAGLTTHFQCWHRDSTTFPSSNLTDGVRVTWTP